MPPLWRIAFINPASPNLPISPSFNPSILVPSYTCALSPIPKKIWCFFNCRIFSPFSLELRGRRCLFQKGHYHGGAESLDRCEESASFDPLQTGKGCSIVHLLDYQRFAAAKSRITDLKFIEAFDILSLRQCLYSIIYQYQGYGSKKRRLLYRVENSQKPQLTLELLMVASNCAFWFSEIFFRIL